MTASPCYNGPSDYVPTFTALAPNGDFYVTDGYGAGFIHRYNIKGDYISTFGGSGNADNQTACPHGIYWRHPQPRKFHDPRRRMRPPPPPILHARMANSDHSGHQRKALRKQQRRQRQVPPCPAISAKRGNRNAHPRTSLRPRHHPGQGTTTLSFKFLGDNPNVGYRATITACRTINSSPASSVPLTAPPSRPPRQHLRHRMAPLRPRHQTPPHIMTILT